MRPIRLLFLIDMIAGRLAGTERHLWQLVSHLDPARFTCFVCRFDPRDGHSVELIRQNVPVYTIPVGRYYGLNAMRQALRLATLIRELRIDIVQTFHYKSDTYGALVARLAGAPVIISSRRDMGDLKERRHIWLHRMADRLIDHFLVNAEAIKARIVAREWIDPHAITTIYNGVDPKFFSSNGDGHHPAPVRAELGLAPEAFVVGSVAHFRPEKGYNVLLDALAMVKPQIPNLRVLIVGGGPLLDDYRNRARTAGLAAEMLFTDGVPNVEHYLPAMDLMCLVPISNEGFSNAILEAMAMGKAVIATDVGGNRESVQHGATGLIIPPNDPAAVAEAILALYRDASMRTLMGKNGRRRVEETFTLDNMIGRFEEFYDSCATGRS